MKRLIENEIFWKALVWRFAISIPLSVLINYIYYHSFSLCLGVTITSNVVGSIAHYFFEVFWSKLWLLGSKKDT